MSATKNAYQPKTPKDYIAGHMPIELVGDVRMHDNEEIPFANIKMQGSKDLVNFNVMMKNVKFTAPFKTKYDKYSNRSMLLIWKKGTPEGEEAFKFFEKLTEDVNQTLHSDKSLLRSLKIPNDYNIPNPVRTVENEQSGDTEYTVFTSIRLDNIPDKDYGAFTVELMNGKKVAPAKLEDSRISFLGSVVKMTYQLSGKEAEDKTGKVPKKSSTMHFSLKLHNAIATKLFETKNAGTSHLREELIAEHGFDALDEAERILSGDSATDTEEKTSGILMKALITGDDDDDEEEEKPAPVVVKKKVVSKKSQDDSESTEVEKPKAKPKITKFSAKAALADD